MHKLLKQAFTLIELLVVIAIIGILSGLIVVAMGGITQKATIAKAQIFSNSLRNALMMNLISEWKFDGTTADGSPATNNDVLDTWSGGNNGAVSPTPPTVKAGSNCVSGSCLQFNGSSNYVNFGSNSNTDLLNMDQFTLAFWIKTPGAYVLSRGQSSGQNGSYLIYYSNGFIFKATSSFESIIGKATGDWQYLAITYDRSASILSVYNNGARTYLYNSVTLNKYVNGFSFMLGTGDGSYFNGYLDDVRVYSAVIPTSQIKEQYYAGLNNLLSKGEITKQDYQDKIRELTTANR